MKETWIVSVCYGVIHCFACLVKSPDIVFHHLLLTNQHQLTGPTQRLYQAISEYICKGR